MIDLKIAFDNRCFGKNKILGTMNRTFKYKLF